MDTSDTQMNPTTPNSNDGHIVYPKVLLTMLEQVQRENKQLRDQVATWRMIADGLVDTEHNQYAHQTMSVRERCDRCKMQKIYQQEVNHQDKPRVTLEDGEDQL